MCAARKPAGKKPAPKKKGGGKKASGGKSPWPVLFAVAVPLVLVGGYLFYQSNPDFAGKVDRSIARVVGFVGNLVEGHDKGKARPEAEGEERPPVDRRAEPVQAERAVDRRVPEPPAAAPPAVAPPAEIPRQQASAATARMTPVTLKQAQRIADKLFGGKLTGSHAEPRAFWYDFELEGARKRYPFDVKPHKVSIATVAIAGPFLGSSDGHVLFVKTLDPQGAEWTNEYAGAVLLSGSLDEPGTLKGATAMQSPGAVITRYAALDVPGDGQLELVLEIESEAPGGYLFRDLAVHAFSSGGTQVLWSDRTLDDGPGVPLETARFNNVKFVDADGDGHLEIQVDVGKRVYRVKKDFTRSLTKEQIVATRTFRLSRGKFRLARK
jgi:hypothetical protein